MDKKIRKATTKERQFALNINLKHKRTIRAHFIQNVQYTSQRTSKNLETINDSGSSLDIVDLNKMESHRD